MEGTEKKYILAIEVAENQRETIRHLFNHNDWNFKDVPVEESADQSKSVDSEDYVIQQSENAEECEHCLSSPCITCETNRQMWWLEEPEMANRSNTQLRKDKYKIFWTMLFHRNVWKDPRYRETRKQFTNLVMHLH